MFEKQLFLEALKIRRAEELLLNAFKAGMVQGTIHTCLGQEIIPLLIRDHFADAFWFSNHRGHGHYLAKSQDFRGLFAEILGKAGGASGGIGGSQHIANSEYMSNGIQGGQAGMAAGYAASKYNTKQNRAVMFIGDGTLGAGHIYESWNLASLYGSKVLYVVEDNNIAQSTPKDHTFAGSLRKRAEGFGLNYLLGDDSNLEELTKKISEASSLVSCGLPTLLHIKTKRLGPHSKGDDNRPKSLLQNLQYQDLLSIAVTSGQISYQDSEILAIDEIFNEVLQSNDSKYLARGDFYNLPEPIFAQSPELQNVRQAINLSLRKLMTKYDDLVMIGEDISDDQFDCGAQYGGAFKITTGLSSSFGDRVISTPISESGITGFGIGLALSGNSSIVEIMFGDFLTQNIDQIVHQMAKIPSMYGYTIDLPVILRVAVGSGSGYGPTHSSFSEHLVLGLPNLIAVAVNVFTDVYSWADWALTNKKPLIFLEPKRLYSIPTNQISYDEYLRDESSNSRAGHLVRPRNRKPTVTVLVFGGLYVSVQLSLEELAKKYEIFIEIFIPEMLNPLDDSLLRASLLRTGKLLIVDETINGFGFSSFLLSELLKNGHHFKVRSLEPKNWTPNGSMEADIIPSADAIIREIKDLSNE